MALTSEKWLELVTTYFKGLLDEFESSRFDLLWSNASPTSEFVASGEANRTVAIDLSDYDGIIVIFSTYMDSSTQLGINGMIMFIKGETGMLLGVGYNSGVICYERAITLVDDSGFTADKGKANGIENDHAAIPLAAYGVIVNNRT